MPNFSVYRDSIGVDYILDIHKYLMKKDDINWCVDLLEKFLLDDNNLVDY